MSQTMSVFSCIMNGFLRYPERKNMRQMRRIKQLLSEADNREVLKRGTIGVLSVIADDDYPYGVPLNYYYDDLLNRIYVHGAKEGMRVDYVRKNPKVSFTVVDKNDNDPENYSTNFRSVIAYGRARIVDDETESDKAMFDLSKKYVEGVHSDEDIKEKVESQKKFFIVTAIDIDMMTGKEAIELVQAKEVMKRMFVKEETK